LLLTRQPLNQGFLLVKLKSSFRKFYGRHAGAAGMLLHINGMFTICSCSSKNTLLTLKDLSSKFIYWIYIRRQRLRIYVSVFVFKDKYYTKLTLIYFSQWATIYWCVVDTSTSL
jgi:hypothetical protein